MTALLLALAAASVAWGAGPEARPSTAGAAGCRLCHTTDTPTKKDPALVPCPRYSMKKRHALGEAPETLTLGSPGGRYGPVRFPHKGHAAMAAMGEGCSACHHYDLARPIHGCGDCHSSTRARPDLDKPDLKAARHRLCVGCHAQWDPDETCASCHAGEQGAPAARAKGPRGASRTNLPERVTYRTPSAGGQVVTFRHDDHARRFGLPCAGCHRGRACRDCHGQGAPAGTERAAAPRGPARPGRSLEEAHQACSSCHKDDPCSRCHRDWPKGFEHRKTGLALDDTHASLQCADCHGAAGFSAPPACGSCHEGRSYPKDKPGKPVAGPSKRR
ncbi:MAG: cytochrome c3 family protein [Elusimicrobia bacterium]|nr:cytochrome c3 family protein [Elusimicrobiota bacterium]